jgi:hypothetical protein
MNAEMHMRDPIHEGINAYSLSCLLIREDKITSAELRKFASKLMTSISETCFRYGAKDVGHIKAYMEFDAGFLHADTLGDPADVTIEGRYGDPVTSFRLVLNSVIYGLSVEDIKRATEAAFERDRKNFGLRREPAVNEVLPIQALQRRKS